MASIINTYDANSAQVYPITSTDALVFDGGRLQGAEAIAAALSEEKVDIEIGDIKIVADHKLTTPKVIAGLVEASNININNGGNLVVDGNTNLNNGLNVNTGNVSVMSGGIKVSGDIDVSVGRVEAPKANFDDCSFGPIHIDGDANKINVTVNTTFDNDENAYKLEQLATQTGVGQHPTYNTTKLYVTGAGTYSGNSSKTYTDQKVYIKDGSLYTKGLYVGGELPANKIDPTQIVLKQTATNLISIGNEFNFIPADYNNSVDINYGTENDGVGNISKYVFYNGNGIRAEIDASAYRCHGGSTYLKADPSANGELIIGSYSPNVKTRIKGNSVVLESSTGTSTFSRDSMILDSTDRYIKSNDIRLTSTGLAGYRSYIQIHPEKITIQNEKGSIYNSYIHLSEQGVESNGNILSQASIIGKNIQLEGYSSTSSQSIIIAVSAKSLIIGTDSLTSVKLSKDVPVGRVFFILGRSKSEPVYVLTSNNDPVLYKGNIIVIRIPDTFTTGGMEYGRAEVIGI